MSIPEPIPEPISKSISVTIPESILESIPESAKPNPEGYQIARQEAWVLGNVSIAMVRCIMSNNVG